MSAWWDRFNQSWASSGPLDDPTPAQAAVGWDYIGQAPPTVEQFNSVHAWWDQKDNWLWGQLNGVITAAHYTMVENDPLLLLKSIRFLFEAPNDGTIYARGNLAWQSGGTFKGNLTAQTITSVLDLVSQRDVSATRNISAGNAMNCLNLGASNSVYATNSVSSGLDISAGRTISGVTLNASGNINATAGTVTAATIHSTGNVNADLDVVASRNMSAQNIYISSVVSALDVNASRNMTANGYMNALGPIYVGGSLFIGGPGSPFTMVRGGGNQIVYHGGSDWYDLYQESSGDRYWAGNVGAGAEYLMTLRGGSLWTKTNISAGAQLSGNTVVANGITSNGNINASATITGATVQATGNIWASSGTVTAAQLTSNANINAAQDIAAARGLSAGGNMTCGGAYCNVLYAGWPSIGDFYLNVNPANSGRGVNFQSATVEIEYSQAAATLRYYWNNPTLNWESNAAGDFWVRGVVNQASDIRLKSDIDDYDGGLSRIIQLQPRRFRRTDIGQDNDRLQIGLIADEVRKAIPEAVSILQGLPEESEFQDILSLCDTPILVTMINAIKELNDRLSKVEKG
jgi:hypothetical protein